MYLISVPGNPLRPWLFEVGILSTHVVLGALVHTVCSWGRRPHRLGHASSAVCAVPALPPLASRRAPHSSPSAHCSLLSECKVWTFACVCASSVLGYLNASGPASKAERAVAVLKTFSRLGASIGGLCVWAVSSWGYDLGLWVWLAGFLGFMVLRWPTTSPMQPIFYVAPPGRTHTARTRGDFVCGRRFARAGVPWTVRSGAVQWPLRAAPAHCFL